MPALQNGPSQRIRRPSTSLRINETKACFATLLLGVHAGEDWAGEESHEEAGEKERGGDPEDDLAEAERDKPLGKS